jgi:uncharacterized protein (DUF1499 family)
MKFLYTFIFLIIFSCTGEKPKDLGIKDGKLAPCPNKPNCVSTFAETEEHHVKALLYTCSDSLAMNTIINAIKFSGNSKITRKDSIYVHAEFSTSIGWVDDVEFMLDNVNKLIHFRSASRYGYSDFGTNRERYNELFSYIKKKIPN